MESNIIYIYIYIVIQKHINHMPPLSSLGAGETLVTDRATAGRADDVHKWPRYEHLRPWI